jgi:hypothetical protein
MFHAHSIEVVMESFIFHLKGLGEYLDPIERKNRRLNKLSY